MELGEVRFELEGKDAAQTEDICRCLRNLFSAREGEQGLCREFGISIEPLDRPASIAKALLVAEFARKVEKFEPRVRVNRVEFSEDEEKMGKIEPKVVLEIV